MSLVQPGLFHRLALAGDDLRAADAWYRRIMSYAPFPRQPLLARAATGPPPLVHAVRVDDLDVALEGLARGGVKVLERDGSVARTDPATTLGIPIEWTDAPA